MKKCYFSTILVIFITTNIIPAGNNTVNSPNLKAQTHDWLAKQNQFGFRENKGQILDSENNPAPYVLYKAEVPGLNIWVTTSGLTYQFLKDEGAR
ncbi:MAG: hypothetical protein HYU69_16715, partial [Bacteroidetes bacterium]|nr:hypothetical protein [Bacteroidota bacterium]